MSIKSEPYYWLVCDGCDASSTEGSDYAAWSDAGTAVEMAGNSDWLEYDNSPYGDIHLCSACVPRDSDGAPWEEIPPHTEEKRLRTAAEIVQERLSTADLAEGLRQLMNRGPKFCNPEETP